MSLQVRPLLRLTHIVADIGPTRLPMPTYLVLILMLDGTLLGVDLRWNHPTEFKVLSREQKDELTAWQKSNEGKKILGKSREAAAKKRKATGVQA